MRQVSIFGLLWVLSFSPLPGQGPERLEVAANHHVRVPSLGAAPRIDGRLDEAVWEEAALVDGFTQFEPELGAPPTERTEIRIGYDQHKLYFGIRCHDSEPQRLIANAMQRDNNLVNDDSVEILLDTFHDRQDGFLFAVNALAAQTDALIRNGGNEINYNWDGIWESAAARDAEGWSAEVAIPFKTLRFPKKAEQLWGLNLHRNIPRKRENLIWSPVPKTSSNIPQYQVSQFGEMSGLRDVQPGNSFRAVPYVIGDGVQDRAHSTSTALDGGVDVKVNITSGLVADLTYNTDFAEAEADQQQINLTRFKLFFPEKREFFLEGSNLFYFGERADFLRPPERIFFFSRRIGLTEDGSREIPVLGGAKVSGKLGGMSLGFLNLTTEPLTFTDRAGLPLREPRSNFSVVRLKQDVLAKSSIGFIGLDKEASGGADNRGFGGDWNFAFGDHFQTGGFLARTSSPGLEGEDWAGQVDVQWDSDTLFSRLSYTEVGDNFNPEMGFFTRLGVREIRNVLSYNPRPKFWDLRQMFIFHEITYITDLDGNIETRSNRYEVDFFFDNAVLIALKYFDTLEVLDEDFEIRPGIVIPVGSYHFRNWFIGVQSVPAWPYFGFARYQKGEFFDGTLETQVLGLVLRPFRGFFARLFWERNDVELPAGDFVTDLYTARIEYSFTPTLSTKTLLQWNQRDNLSVNAIFRWRYRPGSDFFLVYDENRDLRRGLSTLKDRALIAKTSFSYDF